MPALYLDTAAPTNPALKINDGAAYTAEQDVTVKLTTPDYPGGAGDVGQMLVWGSVDPTANAAIQPSEPDSDWITFDTEFAVKLSAGVGRKQVYARLRDDVGNETAVFMSYIDLATSLPLVAVTSPFTEPKISNKEDFDETSFSWECDTDFTAYTVRVVPSEGSSSQAGAQIPNAYGSTNVGAVGEFPASTPITTKITGRDLWDISPGDGRKVIKVFCMDANGQWSP